MQSSPTHVFYTNFQTYFPLSFTVSLFPGIGKIYLFTMTVWVTGLTHSVLLPMNVILAKECEERNSPTPRKWTSFSTGTFFYSNNYDVIEESNLCYYIWLLATVVEQSKLSLLISWMRSAVRTLAREIFSSRIHTTYKDDAVFRTVSRIWNFKRDTSRKNGRAARKGQLEAHLH